MKWRRADLRSWRAFRWSLAHEIAGPAAWIENEIDGWRGERAEERGILPGTVAHLSLRLELLEGFTVSDMPLPLRLGRWLVSDPLFALSDWVYPDWEDDEEMMKASGRGP